ncbi:helix-turn-helix domain-containing protein [Lentzea sp. NPDC058450]|uniref:helix-turn-helix domain-containing protein n=1 Tax=Lentzea sp. NPDC058450 TaxID=3346505 RepID=UPI00364EBBD1
MDSEIGKFLTARRARVAPEDRGLAAGTRRRVPGLRREEVALLAGVSVDYYVRLEQGRAEAPSDQVLQAIAEALGLDATARAHLKLLARPRRDASAAAQEASPGKRALLDAMREVPAVIAGPWQEILYTNRLGTALLPAEYPGPGRNAARHVFLSPAARAYYADWETVASDTVSVLRQESGLDPLNPGLVGLVAELEAASPEFARLWALHDVQVKSDGIIRINHPVAGPLRLNYEFLSSGTGAERIVTYLPADAATAEALTRLSPEPS